ncbi:MAG: PBECR4 domain-containing protein [Spirochaetales bacterium]|nr:PBECR4 domain-containing protein [Spirochaetales bacterium]
MSTQKLSFKQNVLSAICNGAQKYKDIFLDYEYQVFSKSFVVNQFYVISATKSNFLHLTGINTMLSASQFFDKALDGTLSENDFDFNKKGQSEKVVKGSVRRKVRFLSKLDKIFDSSTMVEEKFLKNRISCAFAVSENSFTLGFVAVSVCRPKTLLKGNMLNNPQKIDLIKRRKKGEKNFEKFF